jgi:hypothetical protein
MEVGQRAPLEFNNFHERHVCVLRVFCPVSQPAAQEAPKLNREAPPEFWSMPGEKHVSDVVVAVTTQGLPERGLVVVVRSFAPSQSPVRASTAVTAWRVTAPGGSNRVHRAEAGCREGYEHLGVGSHRDGNIVVPAAEAGVDKLPGVTGVKVGA